MHNTFRAPTSGWLRSLPQARGVRLAAQIDRLPPMRLGAAEGEVPLLGGLSGDGEGRGVATSQAGAPAPRRGRSGGPQPLLRLGQQPLSVLRGVPKLGPKLLELLFVAQAQLLEINTVLLEASYGRLQPLFVMAEPIPLNLQVPDQHLEALRGPQLLPERIGFLQSFLLLRLHTRQNLQAPLQVLVVGLQISDAPLQHQLHLDGLHGPLPLSPHLASQLSIVVLELLQLTLNPVQERALLVRLLKLLPQSFILGPHSDQLLLQPASEVFRFGQGGSLLVGTIARGRQRWQLPRHLLLVTIEHGRHWWQRP
mmetsp:Transcript_96884/g.278248  ORF Transcript_96884/g.278248 Transcript_96884/m.278248 type:complete len:310 (+) Transcript_96884:19-948(+)